ncbi:Uncharacterised protein [Serratia plymuthica]|uniref:Uncharacterized protein n=1 Tax=Serratia plymuthica TaxID=82996 RepID=A0A2X4WRL7_SERPL|nr:Uncharacterised protein [Serratia plymuthica]
MTRGLMALLLLALALTAWFGGRHQALRLPQPQDNQVYIWQRVWTPQHATALAQSRDLFSTLRVLGAQAHPREGWREIPVNLPQLQQDGPPAMAGGPFGWATGATRCTGYSPTPGKTGSAMAGRRVAGDRRRNRS